MMQGTSLSISGVSPVRAGGRPALWATLLVGCALAALVLTVFVFHRGMTGAEFALAAAAWLAWMIFNVVVLPLRAAWAHRLAAEMTDRAPLFVDTEATWRLP